MCRSWARRTAVLWMCLLGSYLGVSADERLAGVACRSVHLSYPVDESVAFYNEVSVQKSAPGTYFMVAGFNAGYFGIQELGNGKKLVLFSVWDPGEQNDPNAVKAEDRVKVEFAAQDVRVKRFGGEGTGGQSFFDYQWRLGVTYRCLVTSTIKDGRTVFTGYFFIPESQEWKRLVSFSTVATKRQIRGLYSFVEDFKRDRDSTLRARSARFGNGWTRALSGDWKPIAVAIFTADANPVTNIDAGLIGDRFYLATGGDTPNHSGKLNQKHRLDKSDQRVPADVIELLSASK